MAIACRFQRGERATGAGGTERTVSDSDSKDVIRRWNREIEEEIRRKTARPGTDGPWKAVAWIALWLFWLALLVGVLTHLKGLH